MSYSMQLLINSLIICILLKTHIPKIMNDMSDTSIYVIHASKGFLSVVGPPETSISDLMQAHCKLKEFADLPTWPVFAKIGNPFLPILCIASHNFKLTCSARQGSYALVYSITLPTLRYKFTNFPSGLKADVRDIVKDDLALRSFAFI